MGATWQQQHQQQGSFETNSHTIYQNDRLNRIPRYSIRNLGSINNIICHPSKKRKEIAHTLLIDNIVNYEYYIKNKKIN